MTDSIYSLIPPVLMLVLVLLTRKVLLSLGAGILVGALFIHDFHILATLKEIWHSFYSNFVSDGSFDADNLLLLLFLLFLGIMTAFIAASGGSYAFGDWMMKRIKSRTGSQLMTAIIGIIIFIDDYFNALVVGQVARPLTDRYRVSRAKLAYFIDSTSAPVTVMSPISSWGAYIIGMLGGLFATHSMIDIGPLEAFIGMVPYNFYAIGALLMVFLTIYMNVDIGSMRKHEIHAMKTGEVVGSDRKAPGDLSETFSAHENGRVYHLIVPIVVLVVVTVLSMAITGIHESDTGAFLDIVADTNVNVSLFSGGLAGVLIALYYHLRERPSQEKVATIFKEGAKAMLPAIYILIFAWMIGSIIETLGTGDFLAHLVDQTSISPTLLPFLFFIISGFMALATGTSWGTFVIMLPIAVSVITIEEPAMLLPTLSAVLAGAVFGDHCSPISDTTILSSTGAGVSHIDHVITQIPYAFTVAFASAVGYLIIGWVNHVWLALIAVIILLLFISFLYQFIDKTKAES